MSVPQEHLASRRHLKSRDSQWARALANWLGRAGVPPDAISVMSVAFAGGAMACFLVAGDQTHVPGIVGAWLGAIVCIQLRLLCNLMDGLVAVEGEHGSPVGAIFNDAPDRVADVLILVGAGYSGAGDPGVVKLFEVIPMGWCCAVVAVWTAYLRTLGASLTGTHDFRGPMAKQHRMAVLCVGALIELVQHLTDGSRNGVLFALTVIFFGGLWTCWRRIRAMAATLKQPKPRP
ncbi:MAG: CDP-alcohol phosphatidyltransferase family protein [Prosthecobacter sp.]|jgi:phosphatidylglycerophosphate synthase|uniref:CDP-alcohol phosphatidyltransferase family protein n=1 Tax=Prosthecobacter sp. TaxID=1965333 RepID=UPI0019EF9981|nr:CDP-alcohol phosphatidyltransferase family protein [Prosthecobacter sp.]MBE2282921.1 CDP-alcohol phosphatidyltransferase family protein [Prosthecobacter sp.]